jgi:hypothetical protein
MFLTNAHPNITFAVNMLSWYNSKPQQAHLHGVKQIIRYIEGTKNTCLLYQKSNSLKLTGYTDVDWRGDLDQRKSTRAYIFTINDTPIT